MKKFTSLTAILALMIAAASCGTGTPAATTAPTVTETAITETSGTSAASSAAETSAPESETEQTTEAEQTTIAVTEKVIPEDSEYVIDNGITDRMKALSELIPGNKARIAKVFRKARAGEPITVAYLGGSITQGSQADSVDVAYAGRTTDWFRKTFPNSEITPVYAGIGATGSYIGVYRTDRDVLSHDPDIVFVDFSVNDTTENTERNIASYDGVIRKLWSADSKPAVITIAMTMEDGTSFQEYHKGVCEAYDIPMISYHDAILDVIEKGHIKWTDISNDNIHPNNVGHVVLTEMITAYLDKTLGELDLIDTENESDFSTVYKSDKYSTAYLVMPAEAKNADTCGWKKNFFGNFGEAFLFISKDGSFSEVETLKFEVEAKSIGVFYGKLTSNGGKLDIVVDGETVKTLDCAFPGGWGNYVEAEEIIDFDECGTHTVEIVPKGDGKAYVTFSALALTK